MNCVPYASLLTVFWCQIETRNDWETIVLRKGEKTSLAMTTVSDGVKNRPENTDYVKAHISNLSEVAFILASFESRGCWGMNIEPKSAKNE